MERKLVTVYIVDDDPSAVELLRRQLEENYSVEIVGTATNASHALSDVIDKEPDLLFLDMEMPEMSGLEFCDLVRSQVKPEMKVVFYTGHDKYMIDAIRREAFDYLLKPAIASDVASIMTRYYENKLKSLPAGSNRDGCVQSLLLAVNGYNEHIPLHLEDIGYFRYENDTKLWSVICADNNTYTLRHRTTAEAILSYSPFFRQTHKGYIVNINYLKVIKEGMCVLREPFENIMEVKLSRGYKRELMSAFYNT